MDRNYRRLEVGDWPRVVFLALAGGFVVLAIVFLVITSKKGVGALTGVALNGGLALYLFRGSRVGVYLSKEGLRIVNWHSSASIDWSDVGSFEANAAAGKAYVSTRSGRHVWMEGLTPFTSRFKPMAETVLLSDIGKLTRVVQQHREELIADES